MIRLIAVAGFALSVAGDIGTGYDPCADASAGRHDHANRCRLRRW